MGKRVVKVPDVGEGIAEVELVSWSVEVGQTVRRNEVVAEVMTDKATVEVPSPVDGVVQSLDGKVGDILLVGSDFFQLSTSADDTDPNTTAATNTAVKGVGENGQIHPLGKATPALRHLQPSARRALNQPLSSVGGSSDRESTADPKPVVPVTSPTSPRPKATPAIRRRARTAGVDLQAVVGSGPQGRISHEDLDVFIETGGQLAAGSTSSSGRPARSGSPVDQPIIGIRRKIAERMVQAVNTIPHITYVEEVDVTALENLRATLNDGRVEDQPRLTVLPFLIRAITNEAINHPKMNAHVDDEAGIFRLFHGVHVGVATQTDNGLVVPVVHHAEAETLWSSAERLRSIAELTRAGKASAAELSGSTITISSLGPIGGIVTTPVINKPEVAIVGVNKIVVRPVFVDGEFVPRKMMNLSCSFDHRVIDGWDAAQFVQALRAQLEQPALLFLDQE